MAITYDDDMSAIRALADRLTSQFGDTYASHYGATNGMQIIVEDDKPLVQDRGKQPYILLSLDDASPDPDYSSARSEFRRVEVLAVATADDNNGARVGESNQTGIDRTMSSDLVQEIRQNYDYYRDTLSLLAISITANREDVRTEPRRGSDDLGPQVHRNPHRITFRYEVTS